MKFVALICCILFSFFSFSQSGTLDLTFNPGDIGYRYGDGFDDYLKCSAIQQDGKIIIGGAFTKIDSTSSKGIARIDQFGNIDTSFHVGLGFLTPVVTITIQPDGKILAGGYFTSYNGIACKQIVRLNPDGSIDNSFAPPSQTTSFSVDVIHLLPNGKMLVTGTFNYYGTTPVHNMVIINSDGSIDPGFDTNLGGNAWINNLSVQPDGKLILSGSFTTFNGVTAKKIVRLFPDLTTDTSFYNAIGPGGVNPYITGVTVDIDSSMFVYGHFTTYNGSNTQHVVKLHPDGTVDNNFSIADFSTVSISNVLTQSSGRHILIGAMTYQGQLLNALRLDSNDLVDISYSSKYMNFFLAQSVIIDSSDRMLYLAGSPFTSCPLLRFEPNGMIDTTFINSSGADDAVHGSIVQNDGKILLYGENWMYNGKAANKVFRILDDGSLDTTFSCAMNINTVNGAAQLNDGRYFIYGLFNEATSANGPFVVLNADGSIDTNFHRFPFPTSSMGISSALVQADNKIVVTGNFTAYNGTTVGNIMRLNPDGTLDPTFVTGTGINTGFPVCIIQPDQKTLIFYGNNPFSYNGTSYNTGIIRLNPNGSIDNTFNIGTGINGLVSGAEFHDGKIIIGGAFTTFNGATVNRIIRLNYDGSLDNSFNTGNGFNQIVRGLKIQEDGKVLVYGDFTSYNGTSSIYFARIDSTGVLDNEFSIPANTDTIYANNIWSMNMLQSGKILLTGSFTEYFGVGRNRVAVLNNCIETSDTTTFTACGSYNWPLNNQTYTTSGFYNAVLTNTNGCDSTVILHLTIILTLPTTIENSFSMPSDANNCVGEIALDISGNPDFELNIDNGAQTATTNGYHLFTNLCPGIHDLQILNFCGDTTTTQFVIPVDSNYVFNNPFIDSLAQDSLGTTLEDCDIYYAGIDTAYIDSIWANGNTVNVIWNIVDSNGSNFDTTSYVLNNGNGVYWLQLSVLCPNKSIGDYFTVTEAIYFENGTVSSAGITELDEWNVQLYPNPTNNLVTITFDDHNAELTVFDTQGKLIRTSGIYSGEQVSLREMETGVYFFQLTTEQGSVVKRVVKN